MNEPVLQSGDAAAVAPAPRRREDVILLAAWIASLGVHVVLFALMVAIPWIREQTNRGGTALVASTGLSDIAADTRFSMEPAQGSFAPTAEAAPEHERIMPRASTALDQLRSSFAGQGGSTGEGLADEIGPDGVQVVGIGTGGGEFSKYGLKVGSGGGGPQFFGLGGEAKAARRIVYIVDRSGSMMGVFDDLREELKRSIDRLRKSQKYHVIFFSTDPPLEAPPGRLVNAIRASKERTFEFIDLTVPEGMTQPIEAMRRAFVLNPDLIFFLSDGDVPEAELLKENLRTWNRKENVRIYTIAYVSSAGRQLLEDIAREHHGSFRFVSEYELGN
jgi:hypothetical protein